MRAWRTVSLAALLFALAGGVVSADNTDNDRVLRGDRGEFIEVFRKDDSGGDKNYQYTITEFKDKHGRVCTVVSGDSEMTIALDCEYPVDDDLRAIEEGIGAKNIRRGYIEVVGVGDDGQVHYRLTKAGEERAERLLDKMMDEADGCPND